MDPSFSVDTHYVTPNPIFVPSPNSQPNRTKRTANDRTKVHQADDLHDQLEGNFETTSGVERQYSDDYFHGIPVSSFFVHPLAKNDAAASTDQLVSAEYGVDNQTPVSSIPALLSDAEDNPNAARLPGTTNQTLDSVRRFHASPQPLVDDLDSTTRPDQPGPYYGRLCSPLNGLEKPAGVPGLEHGIRIEKEQRIPACGLRADIAAFGKAEIFTGMHQSQLGVVAGALLKLLDHFGRIVVIDEDKLVHIGRCEDGIHAVQQDVTRAKRHDDGCNS